MGLAPLRTMVGRSRPNDEIAQHEVNTEQLKTDMREHEPKAGDTLETANWATLNHKLNGYKLRWGQWKTAQADDYWWGDDDEASFATLKNEYNQIRKDLIEFTTAKPKAPEAIAVPPKPAKDPQEEITGQIKVLVWLAGGVVAVYFLLPVVAKTLIRGGS